MHKNMMLLITAVFFLPSVVSAQEHPGFRVMGRHLYDNCDEKVILRGIANPNIWFQKSGLPQYTEIEKTGANVVRIVWDTTGTAAQLDEAIANCIDLGMIPMIECHDATGKWNELENVVSYWTRPDIIEVIRYHEEYLLLNVANECGNASVSAAAFSTGYENAIEQIRFAGIHVPLVIDGTDWGKNIDILQSEGPDLIDYDPDHNLIFSVHMWWPPMYGYDENDIIDEIAQSVNMGLPLIVGEFSQMHGSCSDELNETNAIAYFTIIEQCHLNQVGYIAWSWFGNCNDLWDMTTNGTYATLYDWGEEVAVTSQYSIQNTSVRPYSIVHGGECNPDALEDHKYLNHPEGFELGQNYPNPFTAGTQIKYNVFAAGNVTLAIYNIDGRKIRILADERTSAGSYSAYWDGSDDSGAPVASGLYLYQLTFKHDNKITRESGKMMLFR